MPVPVGQHGPVGSVLSIVDTIGGLRGRKGPPSCRHQSGRGGRAERKQHESQRTRKEGVLAQSRSPMTPIIKRRLAPKHARLALVSSPAKADVAPYTLPIRGRGFACHRELSGGEPQNPSKPFSFITAGERRDSINSSPSPTCPSSLCSDFFVELPPPSIVLFSSSPSHPPVSFTTQLDCDSSLFLDSRRVEETVSSGTASLESTSVYPLHYFFLIKHYYYASSIRCYSSTNTAYREGLSHCSLRRNCNSHRHLGHPVFSVQSDRQQPSLSLSSSSRPATAQLAALLVRIFIPRSSFASFVR